MNYMYNIHIVVWPCSCVDIYFLFTQTGSNSVEYIATGSTQALNYFFLNPSTGQISVRRPLTEDTNSFTNTQYQVNLTALKCVIYAIGTPFVICDTINWKKLQRIFRF